MAIALERKEAILKNMLAPLNMSVAQLAREEGICQNPEVAKHQMNCLWGYR